MGGRERASRRRDRTQAQRRVSQRAGGVACSFYYAWSVRGARDPRPRDPHLPDVARVHFCVLGNLRLDAALYGERRREGRPAGAAMGELRRDGLNGAAIIGYAGFGFLADVFGRKPVTMAYFALAFLSVPVFFIWTQDLTLLLLAGAFSGIFVSGQFTWMSAWLPELFPTRVRATATAFVFNAPRLISWTGPLISGWLIANFGGFSQAAVVIATVYILGLVAAFLPETRGKPLPE